MESVKYFHVNGRTVKVSFPCIIEKAYANAKMDGKTWVYVNDGAYYSVHFLAVYYRHERTWDDHMGNAPCGYYCNVPFPDGSVKRVYMF